MKSDVSQVLASFTTLCFMVEKNQAKKNHINFVFNVA